MKPRVCDAANREKKVSCHSDRASLVSSPPLSFSHLSPLTDTEFEHKIVAFLLKSYITLQLRFYTKCIPGGFMQPGSMLTPCEAAVS